MLETGPADPLGRLHRSLPPPGSAISFALGAAVTFAAALLKLLLDEAVGSLVPPYITFYPAMVIVSLLGGPIVGLAAAGTTLLVAWYFWVPALESFFVADAVSAATIAIYAVTAPLIALIVGGARLSLDRLAASEAERAAAARESVHRTKNLIAVAQAFSRKVAGEVNTVTEFRDVLGQRLHALGIAQDVLLRREWQDAELEHLLQSALAPFLPNPGLTIQKGEHVLVPAQHVRGLCMALYELCTNAMKHGVLAYGRGPATLSWRRENNDCVLVWREEVSAQPPRAIQAGFGTTLIRLALSDQPGTVVQYEIHSSELLATFRWPDGARSKAANLQPEARTTDGPLRAHGTNASPASAT